MLIARKLDSLRCRVRETYANGDLCILDSDGESFEIYINRFVGFDEDIAVKLSLHTYVESYVHVRLNSSKYELTAIYNSGHDEDYDDEEGYDSGPHAFLEKQKTSWGFSEDFEKSSVEDRNLQCILTGIHFLQQLKRCSRCEIYMSTPHKLCLQCACEVVPTQQTYFCSVCQENTRSGDVIVSLPCNHQLHAECFHKLDRCPVCRKGCRASSVEIKVCRP